MISLYGFNHHLLIMYHLSHCGLVHIQIIEYRASSWGVTISLCRFISNMRNAYYWISNNWCAVGVGVYIGIYT